MSSKSLSFVLTLILLASLPLSPTLAEKASSTALPVVEFRGDRTLIYPQRMALHGEETLLDVLEMCPDLMAAGFADYLAGDEHFDSYQLRMDNVPLQGDTRLLLTQLKAKDITLVQIVDNSGVAKGRTGDGRVIDVNFVDAAEAGIRGLASVQGASDELFAPSAQLRYSGRYTEFWTAMTYSQTAFSDLSDRTGALHFWLNHQLSERDRVVVNLGQTSGVSKSSEDDITQHNRLETFFSRLRYFHVFNDRGTELQLLLSWIRSDAPSDIYDSDRQRYHKVSSTSNTPIWMAEVVTPLFTPNLTLMAGYEGDLEITKYGIAQRPVSGAVFDEESEYRVMNNDVYAQLHYDVGPWRLMLGDRLMIYHYDQRGRADNWTKNGARNILHASVAWAAQRHQVQLGYYRKFRNPAILAVFPEAWPTADGVLRSGNPDVEETKTDQYRLTYAYSRPHFTGQLDGSFYHTSAREDYWTLGASARHRSGFLSLTGGFNVVSYRAPGLSRVTYADIRLVPTVALRRQWQLSGKLIWFSDKAPRRLVADDTACYGSLQVEKGCGDRWRLLAQWHDMFYGRRSAALAGLSYCF